MPIFDFFYHSISPKNISTLNRKSFPQDFIFGAASAASQYERAAFEDGREPSIWDKIANHCNGDVADDFYHRYKGDIKLMKFLGSNGFRFPSHGQGLYLMGSQVKCGGGFLSPRIVDDFVDFAELRFKEFGDGVKHWPTIN
ncbi:unnamed protein product [Coffea canephora]|uniref:Beta-glucosidase n=1 Tax=Coffea canephora TaxID=49390 RepID=A0A068UHI7_COFCA|nr:unnamed protein product [Coffea canephora]